jgi:hypothetical protein
MPEPLFPLVQTDVVAVPVPLVKPPEATVYMVIAYYRGPSGEWWDARPRPVDLFRTVEEAIDIARGLSRAWTDRCIVKIKLPAEPKP